ncbi:MAG: CPBP family intramembrane metalloprotease [Candidatus Lokiarchaeota archaeon]|nr:CPBP family intramembrane metalloprotease [Candidatus Lokiarchaeota archaeon]
MISDEETEQLEVNREPFTRNQIIKGFVILGLFIISRLVFAYILNQFINQSSHLQYFIYLLIVFSVISIGLVYLGFSKWIKVDLKSWWYNKKGLKKNLLWGILGTIVSYVVMVLVLILFAPVLEESPISNQGEQLNVFTILNGLFFGFAIASFQEESIFRGFFQKLFTEKYGKWKAIIIQAVMFSLAHIGYYPISSYYLYILSFLLGIVYGWLKAKRGTLLASGIAHGIIG